MPYTNSIENIQKKCPPTERLGLLTKKDLHNVSRDFEVDESILHAEDAVSVDLQNKKKIRRSHRNWTSRRFPHHSSAKDNEKR
ncbi:hypothetical protein TNCV_4595491 [Trichonephila clavipes]|uniref:Uncharacterized protein n=1 Tax=Trichonephila clavipes TaxID=2585209 RepID=A0A8X7BJT1_TRICX|nr:hypothetical protein TNCV_4595491 [Trichonephila clavipes]